MTERARGEDGAEVGRRRRFMRDIRRGVRKGASTGPAVALLLGATTKSALGGGCGCGCGGAGLPPDGATVDEIDAHFTSPGGSFEGELLNTVDTWDWLTFDASAGDEVTLTLEGILDATNNVTLTDPEIALYRDVDDGVPMVGDAVGTDLSLLASAEGSLADFLIDADGTYIAAIVEGSDASDNQGDYRATVSIVPEPSTGTLVGTALAGLGWLRRRSRTGK